MVITRFAPSPTGMLHIGSARTALFCWLWARHSGGKFILRIEDTDRARSTEEAVSVILEGLQWLGLNWDEPPIFQTQRFERYQEVVERFISEGKAYRCYCSKDRLEKLREAQLQAKEKPRYDGHCRDAEPVTSDAPFVVRFKTPKTGSIVFEDIVRGRIEIQNEELDDLILMRSDGTPTYNFTVVVDDSDMGITTVLRGDDHINNTPRQIHLLKAMGASIPQYGHMPMILGPDGKKLSKRTGAASVLEYREDGILPEALFNYLVRLGWSHGDEEIFTKEALIDCFDVKAITASASAVNPEKLFWLNQHYLKTLPESLIAERLSAFFDKEGVTLADGPDLKEVVIAQRERSKTLVEMFEKSRFFYEDPIFDAESVKKHLQPSALPALKALKDALENLSIWQTDKIKDTMKQVIAELGIKFGALAQPARVAVTGSTVSPSMDLTLYLLGKERSLARLALEIEKLEATA